MIIDKRVDCELNQVVIDLHLMASMVEYRIGPTAATLQIRKAADKLSDEIKQYEVATDGI